MNEESVAVLFAHSLLQYGPLTVNEHDLIQSWCPESHQQLFDDHFLDEFIKRIDRHLIECQCNWQHEFVLVNLTIIVMRILTLCKSTKKIEMLVLALKSRQLTEKWIQLINETIHSPSPLEFDQMENLRDKLRTIGLAGLLTFALFTGDTNTMLLSNEHVICLFKLLTTVQDNLILRKKQINLSVFIRNLLRFNERNLILFQPQLNQFLQTQSYQCLIKFVIEHWPVKKTNNVSIDKWIKRDRDIYDGRYGKQIKYRLIVFKGHLSLIKLQSLFSQKQSHLINYLFVFFVNKYSKYNHRITKILLLRNIDLRKMEKFIMNLIILLV